ncbi:MAG TPA: Spy/CpxP family protein refolding chaperone [Thermodesulfobacteriota bacterium]|nr:Spy/CpxP family protein refolding chaperone [Thermodesulfobacteriota bacterium]
MKKAMIASGLVVVMVLMVSYVYAQEQREPPRRGRMEGEKSWGQGKGLSFTPEQKVKFRELRRKFIGENAQLIGGLVAKRLELRSLWSDPKADSQAILAKEGEVRELQNRMRDKIIQYRLEFRSSLTPEQIEKLGMMGGIGFGRGFHRYHHDGGCGCHHHGEGMGRPGMGAGKDKDPSI